MKTKFLVPILAMIFAVGMSFATENGESDPNTDYILVDGNFEPIGMEVNCEVGSRTCRAQLQPNGPVYDLYDAADPATLKPGNGTVKRLW